MTQRDIWRLAPISEPVDVYNSDAMDSLGAPVINFKTWHNGQDAKAPPYAGNREEFLLSAWLDLDIPPRDHLLGGVLCTTSRMLLIGETGIGKTLCANEIGGGIASGNGALGWAGQRIGRVMFLDGEMPAETFKERSELIAERHGRDIPFYGYNRDRLRDDEMPPLNTEPGQKWLWNEIEIIKPDVIFFDSIMCLLTGDIKTPEAWAPVLPLVRGLSAKRIAQVWLHHANDIGRAFGDKTREWQMDTVASLAKLAKVEGNAEAIGWKFTKTRLKTPHNRDQFTPRIIYPGEDWRVEITQAGGRGKSSDAENTQRAFINAYDRLADGIVKSSGLVGNMVAKVKVDAVRDEMKRRGFLPVDERTGNLTGAGRAMLFKAKAALIVSKMAEADGLIWRK